MDSHEHRWGRLELSRFAGTCHRKCLVSGCKAISVDDEHSESISLDDLVEAISSKLKFMDSNHLADIASEVLGMNISYDKDDYFKIEIDTD